MEDLFVKESFHYLLMSNHLLFQKHLFMNVKDTGLTLGQPKVIDYLKDHNGAVQKDIAIGCHIEPASLTSILSGMEKKGLITRKMCNNNRRFLYVFLTKRGEELSKRIDKEFRKIEENALIGFSQAEKDSLNDYLSRIYKNMYHFR